MISILFETKRVSTKESRIVVFEFQESVKTKIGKPRARASLRDAPAGQWTLGKLMKTRKCINLTRYLFKIFTRNFKVHD